MNINMNIRKRTLTHTRKRLLWASAPHSLTNIALFRRLYIFAVKINWVPVLSLPPLPRQTSAVAKRCIHKGALHCCPCCCRCLLLHCFKMRICHLSPESHTPFHSATLPSPTLSLVSAHCTRFCFSLIFGEILFRILLSYGIFLLGNIQCDHPPLHPLSPFHLIFVNLYFIFICVLLLLQLFSFCFVCSLEIFSSSLAAFLRSISRYCSCIFSSWFVRYFAITICWLSVLFLLFCSFAICCYWLSQISISLSYFRWSYAEAGICNNSNNYNKNTKGNNNNGFKK